MSDPCLCRSPLPGRCAHRVGEGLCSKGVAPICVEFVTERPRLGLVPPCIGDAALIRALATRVAASSRVAVHSQLVEVAGYGAHGRVLSIGFDDGSVEVVDLVAGPDNEALLELGDALTNPLLVGIDLKQTLIGLASLLPTEPRRLVDLELVSIILAGGDIHAGHDLNELRKRYLGNHSGQTVGRLGWRGHLTRFHALAARELVADVLTLADGMLEEVDALGLADVVRLEHQVIPITTEIQLRGLPVNEARWFETGAKMETAIGVIRRSLEQAGLQGQMDGDIGVQREQLAALEGTLQSFVGPLSNALRQSPDGRVRGDVRQYGTATGRFSMKGAPLLGIPRQHHLRECFEAEEGFRFVRADFSCFELRVLAGIAHDAALVQIFQLGGDAHRLIAAALLQKSPELVTRAERDQIKQVGFGICFAMTPTGIALAAKDMGVDLSINAAAQFRATFLARFEGVAGWQADVIAQHTDLARTLLGRPRRFLNSEADGARLAFPVQGLAADIMKRCLVELYGELKRRDAAVVMVWHDELVIETPTEMALDVAAIVGERMQQVAETTVPGVKFRANVTIARTLGDE